MYNYLITSLYQGSLAAFLKSKENNSISHVCYILKSVSTETKKGDYIVSQIGQKQKVYVLAYSCRPNLISFMGK